MKSLIESFNKTGKLHHAYLIEGDKKTSMAILYNFLENDLNIKTKANPDFYFNEFESFGIDSGRKLQAEASLKAVVGDRRIFVIIILSITSEAQNSLLKFFEEPAKGSHFFIIVSSAEIFLPTLRSRFQVLSSGLMNGERKSLVLDFIKSPVKRRLNFFNDIIESKDKEKALCFLNDLEMILYQNKPKKDTWEKRDIEIFEIIQKSRDYLRGRAPSIKMILESVALSV